MRIFFILIIFYPVLIFGQNWTHVGQISSNRQPVLVNGELKENLFETGQVNIIEIDPNNSSHFFCGGLLAGLWESVDAGNSWNRIDTKITGLNGVSSISFANNDEIIITNIHSPYEKGEGYSNGIYKYNFNTNVWTALGQLPTNGEKFTINKLVIHKINPSIYFVCTNIGLFRSTNYGSTWSQLAVSGLKSADDITFVTNGTQARIILIGNNTSKLPAIWTSFGLGTNWSLNLNMPYILDGNTKCRNSLIVTGKVTNFNNFELYTLSDYENSKLKLHKISYDIGAYTPIDLTLGESMGGRSALCYNPIYDGIFYAGIDLHYYKNGMNSPQEGSMQMINGEYHMDVHDLKILDGKLFLAGDGGIAVSILPSNGQYNYLYFNGLNNNLNVSLINGFSGASENPNRYMIGMQDIRTADYYDAFEKRNVATHIAGSENDGAIIDKYDNNLILYDNSSYAYPAYSNHYYVFRPDENQVQFHSEFYRPENNLPFRSSNNVLDQAAKGFTRRLFIQDPFRPGRMFFVKHNQGLFQFEYSTNRFVRKINYMSITPTLSEWLTGYESTKGISFSPNDANSIHIIIDGDKNRGLRPNIIKYVGNNFDNYFEYNYPNLDINGNPQWNRISESLWNNINSLTTCNLLEEDIQEIELIDIETSVLDKNTIYVLMHIPKCSSAKIFKYSAGTWTNISNGLPENDYSFALTMDYASNDDLYLSTDKEVYFRNNAQPTWSNYSSNLPFINIKELHINYVDNTVRAGTYGLGIWKSPLRCPSTKPLNLTTSIIDQNYYQSYNITASKSVSNNVVNKPTIFRATESITLLPGFVSTGVSSLNRYFSAFIHGCVESGSSPGFKSGIDIDQNNSDVINEVQDLSINVFPNPMNGNKRLAISFQNNVNSTFKYKVITLDGKVLIEGEKTLDNNISYIDNLNSDSGLIFIEFTIDDKIITKKIIP